MKQLRWPSSPPRPNSTRTESASVRYPKARRLAAGPSQDLIRQRCGGIQFLGVSVTPCPFVEKRLWWVAMHAHLSHRLLSSSDSAARRDRPLHGARLCVTLRRRVCLKQAGGISGPVAWPRGRYRHTTTAQSPSRSVRDLRPPRSATRRPSSNPRTPRRSSRRLLSAKIPKQGGCVRARWCEDLVDEFAQVIPDPQFHAAAELHHLMIRGGPGTAVGAKS